MKTKYLRWIVAAVAMIAIIAFSVRAKAGKESSLVVHEWGTFTSLQGGDGTLMAWKPLETSQLPGFVHKWGNPDLGLYPVTMFGGWGKVAIVALQRMETPVIYFYSDEPQTVDVTVRFPQGFITEWYPRASQIGPSGVFTNQGTPDKAIVKSQSSESLIRWSNLLVSPAKNDGMKFLQDHSGSHYFAARETDADPVSTDAATKAGGENEKFLFYRGVANFPTPLKVTMNSDEAVTISNTGNEPLAHLFVLGIKDKSGNFISVDGLKPGQQKTVLLEPVNVSGPVLTKKISESMAEALVKAGLYPREAAAMVATWKDSWFAENGLRVLYILPCTWTDHTLPMDLKPAPREIARVMVGRAEILAPHVEHSLTMDLQKAGEGDKAAAADARNTLRSLGRFAEPAYFRALNNAHLQPTEQNGLMALLTDAAQDRLARQ